MERKKEEEEEGASGGSPKLRAPQAQGRGGTGMGRPFKGPHPPRQSSGLDGRRCGAPWSKGGQKWRPVAAEVFLEKLL